MTLHALLIILCTCSLAFSQDNFQQRAIYYNYKDTACWGDTTLDYINLIINFNNSINVQINEVDGQTGCNASESSSSTIIKPTKSWYHMTEDGTTKIFFDQIPIYVSYGGLILSIIQKSTVRNPILYGNKIIIA